MACLAKLTGVQVHARRCTLDPRHGLQCVPHLLSQFQREAIASAGMEVFLDLLRLALGAGHCIPPRHGKHSSSGNRDD